MYETTLTVLGRVATTVTQVTFNDGGLKASFRLASTERRFDRGQQTWVDGAQLFLSVVCWRSLADRVVATLRVGDPVIVRGRLRSREYEKDGQVHRLWKSKRRRSGPTWRAVRLRCCGAMLNPQAVAMLPRGSPSGTPWRRILGSRRAGPRRASGYDSRGTTIVVVAEFIYSMQRVRKAHGDKVILDNVTLNFLPGAKIGVVGPNGAGKSSVLRDHGGPGSAEQR